MVFERLVMSARMERRIVRRGLSFTSMAAFRSVRRVVWSGGCGSDWGCDGEGEAEYDCVWFKLCNGLRSRA